MEFPILWNFSVESTNFFYLKKNDLTQTFPRTFIVFKDKRMGYKMENYLENHAPSLFNLP